MRHALWLLCLLGCDDAGPEEIADDVGVSVDGSGGAFDGAVEQDAAPDAAPPDAAQPRCEDDLVLDTTFPLDADGPDTQIHPSVAFDGRHLWLTWNAPRADGGFDVVAGRMNCAGQPVGAPVVLTQTAVNHVDPVIAVSGGRALVAWGADDAEAQPDNLSARYRILDADGAPVGGEERLDLGGNAWMVDAEGTPGGFVLVGAAGDPQINKFQVFRQRFDLEGAPDGDAERVAPNPEKSQVNPELSGDAVTWTDQDIDGNEQAMIRRGDAPPAPLSPDGSALTDVAAGGDHVAWTVIRGGDLDVELSAGADPVVIGVAGRNDHSPALAAQADGGAIAFFRMIRGVRNELHVARYRTGVALTVDPPSELPLDGPAGGIYAPGIVNVAPDTWFVTWSEGQSPAFRAYGRFIRLP